MRRVLLLTMVLFLLAVHSGTTGGDERISSGSERRTMKLNFRGRGLEFIRVDSHLLFMRVKPKPGDIFTNYFLGTHHFYVSRDLVTNGLYSEFLKDTKSVPPPLPKAPPAGGGMSNELEIRIR